MKFYVLQSVFANRIEVQATLILQGESRGAMLHVAEVGL